MAERSDNVDVVEEKNDELLRQLLEHTDAERAAVPAEQPAEQPLPAAVIAAAVDVKEEKAPESKRLKCLLVDGIITFTCPLCSELGFERVTSVNCGSFLHGRRTNTATSTDALENMYIQSGATGCKKELRIMSVQTGIIEPNNEPVYTDVLDDPWVNPATLSQDQLMEYNRRKKLGTLPPPKRATNSTILSQDELLRNVQKSTEPKYLLEYFVVA